jgi:hypothetical protein
VPGDRGDRLLCRTSTLERHRRSFTEIRNHNGELALEHGCLRCRRILQSLLDDSPEQIGA